jgi:signal transduction histidine kinase
MPQSEPRRMIGQAAPLLLGLDKGLCAAPDLERLYCKIVHELKNSLASPGAFLTLLHDGAAGPLNDLQLEYVRYAKDGFEELQTYVDDLGDVPRIESGSLRLMCTSWAVGTLVQRVCRKLSERASFKDRRVAIDIAAGLPQVVGDARLVGRTIAHLLVNAMQATPDGGLVSVLVDVQEASPPAVVVTVIDEGPGIACDRREQIFDPFSQLNPATDAGLGLGLSLARAVAELHGGRIEIEDAPGGGSAVSLTLPIAALET